MAANYRKMYAYLVGQVDEALGMIGSAREKGPELAMLVQGKLQSALLAAEGMYLDDTEDEDRAEFPG